MRCKMAIIEKITDVLMEDLRGFFGSMESFQEIEEVKCFST